MSYVNKGPKLAPQLRQMPKSRRWFIHVPAAFGRPAWRKSLHTTDKAEAERLFAESPVHDLVHTGHQDALTRAFWSRLVTGRKITVRRAIDDYLANMVIRGLSPVTIGDAAGELDLWVRFHKVGVAPISSITSAHIFSYLNQPDGNALSTRIKKRGILNEFFEFCLRKSCVPENPCIDVDIQTSELTQEQLIQEKKIPFTDDEIEQLLQTVGDSDWRGMILFARHFGIRRSDAATLTWGSVSNGRINCVTRKTKEHIDQPLPQDLADWLAAQPRTNPTIEAMKESKLKSLRERAEKWSAEADYIFPRLAAFVASGSANRISDEFGKICQRADIKGKTFHCFRTTVVTRELDGMMEKLGGPEKAVLIGLLAQHGMKGVQKLIGHAAGSSVTAGTYFNPQQKSA